MNKFILKYHLIGIIIFGFMVLQGRSQNAPITTAATITACPNTVIYIPLTVTGFSNIYDLRLNILYNSAVMTFDTNACIPNSSLPGTFWNNVHVSGTTYKVILLWDNITGVTLTDGSPIFTAAFIYYSGSTSFTFDNTSNGGQDCAYTTYIPTPPYVITLNDSPDSIYYHNGQVTLSGPIIWTGNVNTDWSNSNNWNLCGVPGDGTDLVIPGSASNMPVINTTGLSSHNITVQSNATLTVNAAFTCHDITVQNNAKLINNSGVMLTITGKCTIEP